MQDDEDTLVTNVEPEPKRVRKLRRKVAEPGLAFRQLSAVQLSGSVGHTLAQMRQAVAADEDEVEGALIGERPLYDGVMQRIRAAEEAAAEALPHSDVESGELVESPPRGGKEAADEDASEGEDGAVEGGEQLPVSEEVARPDLQIEERPERDSKHSKPEKRKKQRSDRSDSRGRERKESRRQDREREGGHKHKKRRRRSDSRSVSPSDRSRHRKSSRGGEASSGSDSEGYGSKRSRPEAGSRLGARHVPAAPVAGPQVSDALRARVRAMLESVAPK